VKYYFCVHIIWDTWLHEPQGKNIEGLNPMAKSAPMSNSNSEQFTSQVKKLYFASVTSRERCNEIL